MSRPDLEILEKYYETNSTPHANSTLAADTRILYKNLSLSIHKYHILDKISNKNISYGVTCILAQVLLATISLSYSINKYLCKSLIQ